ncbi:MAG: phage tail-type lysozyme domain-containing protein [Candidatus Nomurabacteria bacterium]|jgi:uncharacterized protein YabE (DUF348 family)|nr:phage tail-type lysozyme domain-containing protein [Candidatus Nomurabacteria bacterium]
MNKFFMRELRFFGWRLPLWLVVVASVILLGSLISLITVLSVRPRTVDENGRLVTFYDDGTSKTILTSAGTVAGALKQAEIEVDKADIIEPTVGTELIASSYSVNIYRARPVVVIDGGRQTRVVTAAQTGKTIAQAADVSLYAEDVADIRREGDILEADGAIMRVQIRRAVPVRLSLYGQTTSQRTQAATVAEFLDEKGLKLDEHDSITPSLSAPIARDMEIKVWREGKNVITVDEDVPFEIETIQSNDHDIGYHEVQTVGENGRKSVTYEIEIRGGVEVGRTEIQSLVTLSPKSQIEIVGIKRKGSYTTPSENENITWNYLRAQGFSREQTAGIMGNLQQEHGFQTSGDGLAQWTGGRRAALMAMDDPYSIYTQLDFLMIELNGGYRAVKNSLLAATTVEEAVIIFQDRFERCGVCMQTRRIEYAYNILASH